MSDPSQSKRARIYSVVALIPRGRVATYGGIAALAGVPGQARQVGYALAALPEENDVPWHRVINAKGEISPRAQDRDIHRQRALLESEGIEFDADGRTSLARFSWQP
jgi:methylated-DNA-protein-cysteine methyltransferase-like protein